MKMVTKVLPGLVAAALAATMLILFIILGTLMGALSGWIVGWFFSDTILPFLASFGVVGLKMWQIGASLGFISGYFKTTATKKS